MSTLGGGARRIVVKVGSSLVTNEGRGLDDVAIGEWCRQLCALMRDGREGVYYWPSYEVVKWVGPHLDWPAYGLHNRKPRDVSKKLVAAIIDAFVEAYYTPEAVAQLRR